MTLPPTATPPLRFGRFELQAHERRLLADGRAVRLGGRAFDLLLALADRPGRLVDKATLIDLVWPGLVVQENNLAAQMSALRKLLGEDVIATIPGRGYRFVARLDGAAAMPLAAPPTAARGPVLRTNLPAELPVLLGRGDALAELGALLERHRLVSVVGAGGIGKSLLTQHVLAARRDAYAHGVCWIELGGVSDASALPGGVAAALGVHGGPGDATAALVAAVVVVDDADRARQRRAPPGRRGGVVPGLARRGARPAPGGHEPGAAATGRRAGVPHRAAGRARCSAAGSQCARPWRGGAVRRACARVDRRFAVTDANVAGVIDTCRALDGLPLAIELAAARAPLLGVARLRAAMQDRFAVLTQGRNRAAPERQRTLRAALEWSCELLAPARAAGLPAAGHRGRQRLDRAAPGRAGGARR
jgi:DNA-binding winged helix-turn-helix (wHTH) protein